MCDAERDGHLVWIKVIFEWKGDKGEMEDYAYQE